MPANLNALIRYKTINSCLYGGRKKYNIQELIDACSDALNESRGRGVSISERTLRDDLRVMRSDLLGFNAPIEQKKGLYFYSDPRYTILSVGITDPGIMDAVIKSLIRIRREVKHPELEVVLKKLKALSPESFEHEKEVRALCVKWPTATTGDKSIFSQDTIDYGVDIKIDLEVLIEKIYVAPNAPIWFSELVRSVISHYGHSFEVVHSKLNDSPSF